MENKEVKTCETFTGVDACLFYSDMDGNVFRLYDFMVCQLTQNDMGHMKVRITKLLEGSIKQEGKKKQMPQYMKKFYLAFCNEYGHSLVLGARNLEFEKRQMAVAIDDICFEEVYTYSGELMGDCELERPWQELSEFKGVRKLEL